MKQLDLLQGRRLRDLGIESVSSHNTEWIDRARAIARQLIVYRLQVTADELRFVMGDDEPDHPNAWGAVFKTKEFKRIGFKQSATKTRHAAIVGIWTLNDE
jgi:hypothetical protein